jgi:hypothetical protein
MVKILNNKLRFPAKIGRHTDIYAWWQPKFALPHANISPQISTAAWLGHYESQT